MRKVVHSHGRWQSSGSNMYFIGLLHEFNGSFIMRSFLTLETYQVEHHAAAAAAATVTLLVRYPCFCNLMRCFVISFSHIWHTHTWTTTEAIEVYRSNLCVFRKIFIAFEWREEKKSPQPLLILSRKSFTRISIFSTLFFSLSISPANNNFFQTFFSTVTCTLDAAIHMNPKLT